MSVGVCRDHDDVRKGQGVLWYLGEALDEERGRRVVGSDGVGSLFSVCELRL